MKSRKNLRRYVSSHLRRQSGLILLEGLVAVLIFSLGILGAVALQASMIKANSEAKYRAEAALIVEQRIAQLWIDQTSLASYAEVEGTDISERSGLPEGKRFTFRAPDEFCPGDLSCFVVRVTWKQPGEVEERNAMMIAHITGGV